MVDKMVELGFLGQNSNIKSCVFLNRRNTSLRVVRNYTWYVEGENDYNHRILRKMISKSNLFLDKQSLSSYFLSVLYVSSELSSHV